MLWYNGDIIMAIILIGTLIENFSEPATELNMTADDKRKLIDDICGCLSIGGWCSPEAGTNFDMSDDDIEEAWAKLENEAYVAGNYLGAYQVALLLATSWEREALVRA